MLKKKKKETWASMVSKNKTKVQGTIGIGEGIQSLAY